MATFNQDGAFLLSPAGSAESDAMGSLVVKFYTGTLASGTKVFTTDYSMILAAVPFYYGNGALVADGLDATVADVAGAATVSVKGTNGSATIGLIVFGYVGAQQ